MKTLTLHSEIGDDGKLRLEIPCDLPPGPVDVVLVVQPAPAPTRPEPSGARPARSGLFLGKVPLPVDPDALTSEMDRQWKDKLANLRP